MQVTVGRSTLYLNWYQITEDINRLITWTNTCKQDKYRTKYRLHFLKNTTLVMVWYYNCTQYKYLTIQYLLYDNRIVITVMHCNRWFLFIMTLIRTKTCRLLLYNAIYGEQINATDSLERLNSNLLTVNAMEKNTFSRSQVHVSFWSNYLHERSGGVRVNLPFNGNLASIWKCKTNYRNIHIV
jgi:hypothetical protein